MSEWIKMHTTLLGHRKVARLMGELRTSEVHVLGMLAKFWMNVLRHKSDGNVSGWTAEDVAFYAGYEGEPDAFYRALVAFGWLFRDDGGEVWVNDWSQHSQVTHRADQTTKWREQKRAWRAKKKAAEQGCPPVSADSPRTGPVVQPERRGEERRGDLSLVVLDGDGTEKKEVERSLDMADLQRLLMTTWGLGDVPPKWAPTLREMAPFGQAELEFAYAKMLEVAAARNSRPNVGLFVCKLRDQRMPVETFAGAPPASDMRRPSRAPQKRVSRQAEVMERGVQILLAEGRGGEP